MELVNKIFFSNLISSFRSLFSFILTPTKNAQYFFASSSVLFVFIENSLKGIKIWKKNKNKSFSPNYYLVILNWSVMFFFRIETQKDEKKELK